MILAKNNFPTASSLSHLLHKIGYKQCRGCGKIHKAPYHKRQRKVSYHSGDTGWVQRDDSEGELWIQDMLDRM